MVNLIDLKPHEKWLIETENGLRVSADCPTDVLHELKEINAEYMGIYGENVLLFNELYPADKIAIMIEKSGGKLTNELIQKKYIVDQLRGEVCDDLFRYFDDNSFEMLDLKISVLTALKEGKPPDQIPRFYDMFELLPPEGQIWD